MMVEEKIRLEKTPGRAGGGDDSQEQKRSWQEKTVPRFEVLLFRRQPA